MDENVKRQRELAESIMALNGSLEVRETGKPTRALWHYAPELAELVLAQEPQALQPPDKRVRDALSDILNYHWDAEETDYEQSIEQGDIEPGPGSGHVFEALTTVRDYLDGDGHLYRSPDREGVADARP